MTSNRGSRPSIEEAFEKGLAKGRGAAEIDRGDAQAIAHWLEIFRWQATRALVNARRGPTYRRQAASMLGMARGYREVVR